VIDASQEVNEIGVLIVVGVCLYREGLTELLSKEGQVVVKGVASDHASAVTKARDLSPNLILLDIGLPNSLSTVREILEVAPVSKVVALAVTEKDDEVLSYAEAGVSGYVPRDGSYASLVECIRSVARGELLCSPRIAALLLRRVAHSKVENTAELERLTRREWQIVRLVQEGLTNKEIAKHLNIEVSTVKNHVHHTLEKLRVAGRVQLAVRTRAALLGLTH
jgi:DNA-binding NarL/FixJ family response regulator